MNMRNIMAAVLCLSMGVFALAGCGAKSETPKDDNTTEQTVTVPGQEAVKEFSEEELLSGKHHVQMEFKDKGVVTLELDADAAPISVTNFIQLAEDGFYDGLTYHRIFTDMFMQGGDPMGNGMGGPGYRIKGEFTANGVDNQLKHTRGAISMARTNDPDGGGCQFFIMDDDYEGFDGQYAVFGYVTDGMDIIDDICHNTPIVDNNGSVMPEDQPVMTKVTVID